MTPKYRGSGYRTTFVPDTRPTRAAIHTERRFPEDQSSGLPRALAYRTRPIIARPEGALEGCHRTPARWCQADCRFSVVHSDGSGIVDRPVEVGDKGHDVAALGCLAGSLMKGAIGDFG